MQRLSSSNIILECEQRKKAPKFIQTCFGKNIEVSEESMKLAGNIISNSSQTLISFTTTVGMKNNFDQKEKERSSMKSKLTEVTSFELPPFFKI